MLNVGDIIFQIFALAVPFCFVIGLVLFARSMKQRQTQLNRIEEKLDQHVKK